MNQVLDQEVPQTEEFYKQEVKKILFQMQEINKKMDFDQEEINRLEKKSVETLNRIETKIQNIENLLT